jgi:hypothetical protein
VAGVPEQTERQLQALGDGYRVEHEQGAGGWLGDGNKARGVGAAESAR